MKSVMTASQHFSQVPRANIPRSQFDRSNGMKTTMDSGYLVPMFVDRVLPADTFNVRSSFFARMATPITPFMDNMFFETFWFFIPLRLLWVNFQKFMGEQDNPGDSTDYLNPFVNPPTGGWQIGSLADYFGLPVSTVSETLPGQFLATADFFRAYNLVYNYWFRDQNLIDSVPVNTGDGPDAGTDYVLLRRGKRHDYFTSCLPWPQKGPAVDIPLGTTAPIIANGDFQFKDSTPDVTAIMRSNTAPFPFIPNNASIIANEPLLYNSGLLADLSEATAATINSLRMAFQVQKLFERDARGGTRYKEILLAHFGVVSPDARLQWPEFLGSSSQPLHLSPIAQTSSTDEASPQGNLAAMGTISAGSGFVKSFVEHGIILGIMNVRADLNYQQGVDKMFSLRSKLDFYWPALSHIGEQPVFNREIFYTGNDEIDNAIFGYQEAWADLRYKRSIITGLFRSVAPQSLDIWHLAQDFSATPVLGEEFINDDPPVDRVIATPEEPQFLVDVYHKVKCARAMPTYSVPGLIDHF